MYIFQDGWQTQWNFITASNLQNLKHAEEGMIVPSVFVITTTCFLEEKGGGSHTAKQIK